MGLELSLRAEVRRGLLRRPPERGELLSEIREASQAAITNEDLRALLACLERARQLSPGIRFPEREAAELRSLLKSEPAAAKAPGAGIGYRRKEVSVHVGGAWRVTVPGYYFVERNAKGAPTFEFGDRSVYCSPSRYANKMGQYPSKEQCLRPVEKITQDAIARVAWEARGCIGRAGIVRDPDGSFFLQGIVAGDEGETCFVCVTYRGQSDHAWAERVFRSIWMHGPELG